MTRLAVPHIQQQRSKWCWAACIEMSSSTTVKKSGRRVPVGNHAHGTMLCCTQLAMPQFCNKGLSVTLPAQWGRQSYAADYIAGALPFADIAACIDGDRPFQVGLSFNASSPASIGHAVLGVGYRAADEDDTTAKIFCT